MRTFREQVQSDSELVGAAVKSKQDRSPLRPFLRFPGCKAQLVTRYRHLFPSNYRRYHEPFLGSGAVFFALQPGDALLSDINAGLVGCYVQVRDRPTDLLRRLAATRIGSDPYYRVRREAWRYRTSLGRATRFLYLNRLAFNGIWRTNRQGVFNTPYGDDRLSWLLASDRLEKASSVLKSASLRVSDYRFALRKVRSGDFVVLDPPYLYPDGLDRFSRYHRAPFTVEKHRQLAKKALSLVRRGAKVMITNADNGLVRSIYRGLRVHRIMVNRFVNSVAADRGRVSELVLCKGW